MFEELLSVDASQDTFSPKWSYPTRSCRVCFEDVTPTVTIPSSDIALQVQRPLVEYVNDDGYGRLVKPCMCRGSSRYIHELCLLKSRTESGPQSSLWKCQNCGYQFNFKNLTLQWILRSERTASVLTMVLMLFLAFILGFIAEPIINLLAKPYDTLIGRKGIWAPLCGIASSWQPHFLGGMWAMAILGYWQIVITSPALLAVVIMSLFQSGEPLIKVASGRDPDRYFDGQWVASITLVLIGLVRVLLSLYKWTALLVKKSLRVAGTRIVDTQLPDDDDDINPPTG